VDSSGACIHPRAVLEKDELQSRLYRDGGRDSRRILYGVCRAEAIRDCERPLGIIRKHDSLRRLEFLDETNGSRTSASGKSNFMTFHKESSRIPESFFISS